MQRGSQVIDSPPAPTDEGGGGGGWAWLLTARGIIEAELVRGVLESAGVLPVALDGRDPSPGAWMFLGGNVNALVRVILLEAGFEQPEPPAPAPASARPPRLPRRMIWLVITAVVIAIFLIATMHGRVT